MINYCRGALILAGFISGLAAAWHLMMIVGGPTWYEFARAPHYIVTSARNDTLTAPLSAILISVLMFTCSAYAFSGAGLIKKVPLVSLALPVISLICLTRAIYISPLFFPMSRLDTWNQVASSVWGLVGICFLLGALLPRLTQK